MKNPPAKLHKDSIVEALCEIRFECDESASLPELVIGKLAGLDEWTNFQTIRLPISNIPAEVRALDPNLRSQPVLELRDPNGNLAVKIGVNIFSYSRLQPYPGWDKFQPEINKILDDIFDLFKNFKATRLGLRYVNIFTKQDHDISSVCDLNYSAAVSGVELKIPLNINYQVAKSDEHIVQVRMASPEYVAAPAGQAMNALVDLDVSTPNSWSTRDVVKTKEWVEQAHEYEKEEFFKLFTDQMKNNLVQK